MAFIKWTRFILVFGLLISAGLLVLAGRSIWMWLDGVGSARSGLAEVIVVVAAITAVRSFDFDAPALRLDMFPAWGFIFAYLADAILILAGAGAWLFGVRAGQSCFREHGAQLFLVSATPMALMWGHSALMTRLSRITYPRI